MSDSNDKPFLTYEQQITKLIDKGLTIPDKNYALELLKKHSYFALISGYKNPLFHIHFVKHMVKISSTTLMLLSIIIL